MKAWKVKMRLPGTPQARESQLFTQTEENYVTINVENVGLPRKTAPINVRHVVSPRKVFPLSLA